MSCEKEITPAKRLASVEELESPLYRNFMIILNFLAEQWNLRQCTIWSKVWEYPWLWYQGLNRVFWDKKELLDCGSELSPMPWFFALLGAKVTLLERDAQWIPLWQNLKEALGVNIGWHITEDEHLPFADHSFDVVTSFSVIEHQFNKEKAVNEVIRILKPGGLFALSFDICESALGMTFPEWNGKALTLNEFENLIWNHPKLDHGQEESPWNIDDIPSFIKWNLQAADHHNYTVGAALLRRKFD